MVELFISRGEGLLMVLRVLAARDWAGNCQAGGRARMVWPGLPTVDCRQRTANR